MGHASRIAYPTTTTSQLSAADIAPPPVITHSAVQRRIDVAVLDVLGH
jgi:hypothetical protein